MAKVSTHTRHPPYSCLIAWWRSMRNNEYTMSEIFCSSVFFGWMYAMAISHSCHTDICRTVRRFSRLLLHNNVISERNSFFTSSNCSVCFDCRIRVATTLRITEKRFDSIVLSFRVVYICIIYVIGSRRLESYLDFLNDNGILVQDASRRGSVGWCAPSWSDQEDNIVKMIY